MTINHRTAEGADSRDRIDRYLHASGMASRSPKVVPLTGDASDRRYYRILLADGDSVVLALHAGPIDFATLPFANVSALEDLGDVTLQAHLGAATPVEHAALYREAVALIERLQRRGPELANDRYVSYGIAFDEAKLTWELDFFARHFVEGYRGVSLS